MSLAARSDSSRRSARATSYPSMSGSPMSQMTTSGFSLRASAIPVVPSRATVTSCPSISSTSARVRAESTLSSMTRTRRLPAAGTPAGAAATRGDRGASGSVIVNSDPFPGPSLRAAMAPPCSSTSPFASASPRPSPALVRARRLSPCANGSNMSATRPGSMPMPVSFTRTVARPSCARSATVTAPCGGVNLLAFWRTLPTTWVIRVTSMSVQTAATGKSRRRSISLSSKNSRWSSHVRRTRLRRSTTSRWSWILPREIRVTSRRSSIRRVRWSVWRRMARRARADCGLSEGSFSRRKMPLRMGASGLRSSCERTPRNSVFRRSASRTASSATFRSVMSWA
jgi:hypothetical protein